MMPILSNSSVDIAAVLELQCRGAKPVAFELPRMNGEELPTVAAASERCGVRLFANTLGEGFIRGYGSDTEGAREPQKVWARLLNTGVKIFQTDEPEGAAAFRDPSERHTIIEAPNTATLDSVWLQFYELQLHARVCAGIGALGITTTSISISTASAKVYLKYSENLLRAALRDTRIVAVGGPRQSGKTTLRGALHDKVARTCSELSNVHQLLTPAWVPS
jgi:hypothetical protein